ncbi:alpha-soluble NSF attachment protein [Ascodesmis nigricans]|uniref:Alpha-soluble NSF attachment protein n=1 Tax=Ascodesmis nigricans TaxID=341454 RepID=A0A4S2N6U3_9PEZI|nr:alpha-soluble NSF attachment protein [Ascodesmis nigricans]
MNDPRSLLAQADKLAASAEGGFSFGSLFGSGKTDKLEQAADLYTQAANSYKAQNMYVEAAKTFEKAAHAQQKLNEPDDAAMSFVEASRAYDDGNDPHSAVRAMAPALDQFTLRGNFRRVADYKKDLAVIYHKKIEDHRAAVKLYQEAGDRYKGNRSPSLASKMYQEAALLLAVEQEYREAIRMFEETITLLPENLQKFQAPGYALNAGICSLCNGDLIDSRKKLNEYQERGWLSPQHRELMLLQNLLQAVEEQNGEMFSDHLFNYNQVNTLDAWKTELLLRVKNTLSAAPPVHEETGEVDLS